MKYFKSFNNPAHWKREEDKANELPNGVQASDVHEITEDQYTLSRFLTLKEGVVSWKQAEHDIYLVKKERCNKIKETKKKLKKIKNADLDKLNNKKLEAILKQILDVLVDRDELSEEVL